MDIFVVPTPPHKPHIQNKKPQSTLNYKKKPKQLFHAWITHSIKIFQELFNRFHYQLTLSI